MAGAQCAEKQAASLRVCTTPRLPAVCSRVLHTALPWLPQNRAPAAGGGHGADVVPGALVQCRGKLVKQGRRQSRGSSPIACCCQLARCLLCLTVSRRPSPPPLQSVKYNIPVAIWLPERYPLAGPLAYVVPTPDMVIKPRHTFVDASGARPVLPARGGWRAACTGCCVQLLAALRPGEMHLHPSAQLAYCLLPCFAVLACC